MFIATRAARSAKLGRSGMYWLSLGPLPEVYGGHQFQPRVNCWQRQPKRVAESVVWPARSRIISAVQPCVLAPETHQG